MWWSPTWCVSGVKLLYTYICGLDINFISKAKLEVSQFEELFFNDVSLKQTFLGKLLAKSSNQGSQNYHSFKSKLASSSNCY